MKEELFEAWDNDDYDEMVRLLKRKLSQIDADTNRDKVAHLKSEFETNLPHRVVSDAVGCDVRTCRDIRWMGEDYGVVDRTGTRERVSIPPSKKQRVMERDGNQCVRCGADEELEIHHIIPLSQGGLDFAHNLCVLCEDCNKEAHAGDFSSKRTAYDGRVEFWEEFVDES